MLYFSQFGEDKFMIENYLNDHQLPKFYIELGALDGVRYSNTKTLEDEYGWTGILIEPIPSAYERLRQNRPKNILVNSLVGSGDSEEEFFFFNNPDLQCVSSIRSTQKESHQRKWMTADTAENEWLADQIDNDLQQLLLPTETLGSILRRSGIPSFGFLSLDVEGHELEVLKSHDWHIPIAYMLVEGNRQEDRELHDYILAKGGRFEGQIHLNMLFSFLD
jgi:FkbM family methyltransferase